MDRAFLATKDSKYYKDLELYFKRVKEQRELVKKFLKDNNIESERYYIRGNGCCNCSFDEYEKDNIRFGIVPTKNDLKNYEKQITKAELKHGLRMFRANSKLSRSFQQYCIDNKVIINILSLDLRDYLKSMDWSGYSFQRVPCEQGYYLKVSNELLREDDVPKGFIPIKLSEFYKKLEEYNENKEI